ncbi:hypothetical protein AALB_1436 [Agarivorans albus MKT 106]|uniref:Uncharacterized protein n=1 Tax=Agarivorans albus MKT 106 TaxID=1331007 RepID=R9PSW0_AGAAL|nr:hypothetical protein AALB_1436 [Agarivorans albus MKT 106]
MSKLILTMKQQEIYLSISGCYAAFQLFYLANSGSIIFK